MKVIFNVDDFGMTPGINQAVYQLNQLGVVKSTSAFINAPFIEQGLELVSNNCDLAIGLHLTLNMYQPLVNNRQVQLAFNRELDLKLLTESEVYDEFKAQLEKFIKVVGTLPSHIDTHYHLHLNFAQIGAAALKLSSEYDLHLRGFDQAYKLEPFCDSFVGDNATVEYLINYLDYTDLELVEVMSHAGLLDEHLAQYTSLVEPRNTEYQVLSSQQLQKYLIENNIKVTNFINNK